MRNLYGYGGLLLFLAGLYLALGVAVTLVTAGLILMWISLRMDEGNADTT